MNIKYILENMFLFDLRFIINLINFSHTRRARVRGGTRGALGHVVQCFFATTSAGGGAGSDGFAK